ncbi:MAG: isoleucine--tRNA ligase [Porphyromonas sp.]|nr:isoleucine--tRNA ligase [Porphyromonas sp.]
MNKKYAEYSGMDLASTNRTMLEKWKTENLFAKSLNIRNGAPDFVFFEGPPSANGMPGIHHIIARTLKDVFCRYKTMKGFRVDRKAGWDTHGLPVELGVEKNLGITKADIGTRISIEEYNHACRKEVMKYTKEWEDLTDQMGYWVDMQHPYITYDNKYIETLWYMLKKLYEKGLLYKGYTIQPYSPAAGTGLSSHELNQPGCYRDVKDTTCTAQFEICDSKTEMQGWGQAYFLAWTTTPWTLPSNTALCVGGKIEYSVVRTYNPYTFKPITVVLASDLVGSYFHKEGATLGLDSYKEGDKVIPYQVVAQLKGADLVGMRYKQLIPWIKPMGDAFRVISGDFVTTEDGTGIVHIAPTFGADDARVAQANDIVGLLLIDREGKQRPMVDLTGKYYGYEDLSEEFISSNVNRALYDEYAGHFVKTEYEESESKKEEESLDLKLCMMLKQQGLAFKIERYVHNYPHCWRTDKPILYYPLDSWFIKSTAVRERMIELNETILWKPASTGTGRFGKWLENLQDWNLSRSRYWGTPLPIWRTEDGKHEICIGSVQELYEEIEKAIEAGVTDKNPLDGFVPGDFSKENYDKIDLHRPFVDEIILVAPNGEPMHRESDLIDVWFDSGAMPFAQWHYPFENREFIDNHQAYPADFIAEGVDQTRGWFYTLHALSTMLMDSVAFKAVISNGLVLDKNGNKMSKRLGNGVDPFETIRKYGSDPLRWYMMTNASPWDNLKFDIEGLEEVQRKFFGTLYNTYSFFALYANLDGFYNEQNEIPYKDRPEIDRWILSKVNTLIEEVDTALQHYEPTRAGRAIAEFVTNQLSNWYVRLCRKRFWGGGLTEDKLSAYQSLYICLETVAKLMAPIAPFYADMLYRDLRMSTSMEDETISVHLADFPTSDNREIDTALEARMELAQNVSSMVLALRRKANLKVRQPLTRIIVPTIDKEFKKNLKMIEHIVINEVNVKAIETVDPSDSVIVKRVKPNFKALGPKCGAHMKQVAAYLTALEQDAINSLEQTGSISFEVAGSNITVDRTDVEIFAEDIPGWLVANEGTLTLALDINVTDELRREGEAREFINRVQNLRKSKNFDVVDKIKITIKCDEDLQQSIQTHMEYICTQVQALDIAFSPNLDESSADTIDINEIIVPLVLEKVQS